MTDTFLAQREHMVREQLVAREITNPLVLKAFEQVPRELFVAPDLAAQAYEDRPLPIDAGQTISQPYIVARMLQHLELTGEEHALEIGAGSGYAAAILGKIVRDVQAVERIKKLASSAAARLTRLGVDNVHVHLGDGTLGWIRNAPYDVILVSAGGPEVPRALADQLAIRGRLIMPISASPDSQMLIRVRRVSDTSFEHDNLERVKFVPLLGAQGYPPPAAESLITRFLLR